MKSLFKTGLLLVLLLGIGYAEARAQSVGNCERALGEAFLDVNNVRARILNGGGLFYRGSPHVYEVPKGGGSNAIFASGVWFAGEVDGQLRAAATRYGEWEFFAGPLDDNGNPPDDCAVYDRVYKVGKTDIDEYETSGSATPDLRDWPTGLGAPTYAVPGNGIDDDEDGEIDEANEVIRFDITEPLANRVDRVVNLAAGERPAILGDQTIWWVMNDRGGTHESTDSPPIGLEVHGTAFAFNTAGDIGNTTFYKYNVFYKGNVPLENTYMGIFSDPDLGNFDDDYIGSDTTLGLGYVYNSDDNDEGGEGYGTAPPAAGYDFFQGPIVPSPGDTAYVSGRPVPDFTNLEMTTFAYYNNGADVDGDPQTGLEYYNYMRGFWKDGAPFTFGGSGRDFSTEETKFVYTGDPVTGEGWSEFNPDPINGSLPAIDPADRRFVMATGPFTINPGDQQEIVFGLIWARGTSNLDSVDKLKQADALAQAAFDVNFELPSPPAAPSVRVTELDGQIILEWDNTPRSNNYLETYREEDPFAPDEDKEYIFEGYEIIQYAEVSDQVGQVIATYDVPNGVTRVIDGVPGEPTQVSVTGNDGGVQNFHVIQNLTNYTTYYFGVQAYAYNEPSFPKVYRGPVSRVEVVPTRMDRDVSAVAAEAAQNLSEPDIVADAAGIGQGEVWVDIVNPAAIQEATYTVEFYSLPVDEGAVSARIEEDEDIVDKLFVNQIASSGKVAGETTYDIKRDGVVVFDGSATGSPAPQREKVTIVDGLQFSVIGPEPGFRSFAAIQNAAGPIDPPDMAAYAFNSSGFPQIENSPYPSPDRPTRDVQQSQSSAVWGFHAGGAGIPYGPASDGGSFLGRSTRGGGNLEFIGANDFEMRFTQACTDAIDGTLAEGDCLAWRAFDDGAFVEVPFELWYIGLDTPDDPSDDYRMVPVICEEACGAGIDSLTYDIGGDHAISGGDDDPFTDWVYWYQPTDLSPGEAGYNAFYFGDDDVTNEVLARTVLVAWNLGAAPPYDPLLPEIGTTFRLTTLKPNQPGDTFTLATTGLGTTAMTDTEAMLDQIGIVPNPYKGASNYERSQLINQVRFTNLPEQANIRVFTLNGTLIKTFQKNSSSRLLEWNLTTDNNLPIASGVYLIHVEVPGVGEKVLKFACINRRVQLNTF